LIKGKKVKDEVIDPSGRKFKLATMVDDIEGIPDYRGFYQLYTNKDPSGYVIHHLLEKGSDFAYLFDKKLINAPKSLIAIPKGDINSALHLSEIAKIWKSAYKGFADALHKGAMSEDQVREAMIEIADRSEKYIQECLIEIVQKEATQPGKQLTRDQIEIIVRSKLTGHGF
jgi:hypothetical protein